MIYNKYIYYKVLFNKINICKITIIFKMRLRVIRIYGYTSINFYLWYIKLNLNMIPKKD